MFFQQGGGSWVSNMVMDQAAAEQEARRRQMARAWERYNGIFPNSLKETKSDPKGKDNVKINFARWLVNTGVSFLFGQGVTFEVDGDAKSDANQWLADCWQANKIGTLLHKVGINGGVTGHCFIKVIDAKPFPRLVNLDPEFVTPIWAADDFEKVEEWRTEWTGIENGQAVAFRQVMTPEAGGQSWTILDQQSRGDNAAWVTTDSNVWPYSWAPIFQCQNMPCPNAFFGLADLEADVLDGNESLNFIFSNLNRIIRMHAHPKTWARGVGAGEIDFAVDKLTVIPSETGELKNLEMQSDLSSSLEFARKLKEIFHEVTSVPEIAAGKFENVGQLSGLAMKILYGPILRLTGTKKLFYGEMMEELSRRLLEMKDRNARHRVKSQWPEILPEDVIELAGAALTKQQAGVSQDTTLSEMGYDPEVEKKKREAEQADAAALGDSLLSSFEKGALPGQGGPGGNADANR